MNKIVQTSNWHNISGYQSRISGLSATPIPAAVRANAVIQNIISIQDMQAKKAAQQTAADAALLDAQTASANNYHAVVNSFRGTVSDADMAVCIANVNPFKPAEVASMKACLESKVAAVNAPASGGGSGSSDAPASDSGDPSSQSSGITGKILTTTNMAIGGGIVLLIILSYFGYRYYKSKHNSKPTA